MEELCNKTKDLEDLFDSQIQTLKNRGCPEQIVEMLQRQRSSVLQKASEILFTKGNIPFIPVIPQTRRSAYDLMTMVRNNDEQGYAYMTTKFTDEFDTPKDPYYVFDIEDGQTFLGKSPEKAIYLIKQQSRSPLTAVEVIALTTHTDVLLQHCVDASGSRYSGSDNVPGVCLNDNGQPGFSWGHLIESHDCWGSASCGSRLLCYMNI